MKDAIITTLVAVIAFGAGVTYGTKRMVDMQTKAAQRVADMREQQEAE